MSISGKVMNSTLVFVLIALLTLVSACNDNDDGTQNPQGKPVSTQEATQEPPATPQKQEDVVITIGSLTDLTGVASNALYYIDMALDDVVKFYNEENLIPGVKLEVIKYDTYYDYSRFLPGYEWLREKGADVILNFLPPGAPMLKPKANKDKCPVFTMTANVEPGELDGSYVYCLAIAPTYEAYTILDWIANNDPDFPQDRPARIGGYAYAESYSNVLYKAAKEYCKEHPDQYEWEIDFLTDFKFTFDAEIEELKDCDYVFTPAPPMAFTKAYRLGGGKAKFLWTEVHTAFAGMYNKEKLDLWDGMDGSYFILSSGWYNDENDPVVEMINSVLNENHAEGEVEEILTSGGGYRTAMRADMLCEIIKETVESVGAENFNTEALAQTANSWSFSYGDIENFCDFTETKRFSQNYYMMYEVQVDESNPHTWQYITRVSPDPIPQLTKPS